tara:strand:+ start:503 stop:976 length:474 start_codon:yes stop_codon:yes gene_type:complete
MTEDLSLVIEQHQKEIWEWKQKESQWIRDKNQLEGNKRIVEELSQKIVSMGKKVRDAEGETSLVKAIGINSPEMKAAQARIKELESSRTLDTMDEVAYRELKVKIEQLESTLGNAQEINDVHQRYNGKLQKRLTEVEEDNRRLAKQIEDINKNRMVM